MDDLFGELLNDGLLGVDSDKALNFFLTGLMEVTGKKPGNEMFYVAGILAHYSLTSRYDTLSMPPLANLSEAFEQFFFLELETKDPEILEIWGSQLLLFDGFFRDQMSRRHNVNWYDEIGQSVYDRVSVLTREAEKRRLFEKMSESFPSWAIRCRDLNRSCRDNRYLLKIN
jgi:hypothetical protein